MGPSKKKPYDPEFANIEDALPAFLVFLSILIPLTVSVESHASMAGSKVKCVFYMWSVPFENPESMFS